MKTRRAKNGKTGKNVLLLQLDIGLCIIMLFIKVLLFFSFQTLDILIEFNFDFLVKFSV